jgi:tetratricopeptide (TPR) repeat protein
VFLFVGAVVNRRTPWVVFIFFALLTIGVYFPGLNGDFLFDDSANILENDRFQFKELNWQSLSQVMASGDAGLLKRPISMASFALNVATTGFQPYFFKLTNLAIHVINGVLLFVLCLQLLAKAPYSNSQVRQTYSACIGAAALWLLHPLNLTSVLYVVQRMTSLAALFTLLALIFFTKGRQRIADGRRGGWLQILILSGASGVTALLCKETSVLLVVYMVLIELFFYRGKVSSKRDQIAIKLFYGTLIVVPLILMSLILIFRPGMLIGSYDLREFTMAERLMTEARVIWMYIGQLFMPNNSTMSLYHDDFSISKSLIDPPETIICILGIVALLVGAWCVRNKAPMVAFAIFWFLGGHLLESTFLPLEIAHEHRNYLPIVGPLLGISFYACNAKGDLRRLMIAAAGVVVVTLSFLTFQRATAWGDLKGHSIYEAEHKPNSERARIQMGRIYAMLYKAEGDRRYLDEGIRQFEKAAEVQSNQIGGYVGLIRLYYLKNQQPPDEAFAGLISRVEKGHQPPATPSILQNLSNCNLFQFCKVPDEKMIAIFSAFLSNPDASESIKPIVSLIMAQYVIDKMGDGAWAIEILKAAVTLQPTYFHGHRNLARLYRLAGLFDLARAELNQAKKLDKYNEFSDELQNEELKLKEQEESAASEGKR